MSDRKIEAKELTVGQVKIVLEGFEKLDSLHTLDFLFPEEGVPALAVSLSTGIPLEELDGDIPVSEMHRIVRDVKEKNSFFLKTLKHLADAGRLALAAKLQSGNLTGPSAD